MSPLDAEPTTFAPSDVSSTPAAAVTPAPTARGCVYFIGAGPGAIAYLTVQAYALLTQAEVLVYDALVDPHLLDLLPPTCQTIPVGKRGGQPSTLQADINALLVHYCEQGKQVIRLKSGDPLIYGRTTSEMQTLQAANCPYTCVPGLSSALSAPLFADIPLTDPVLSTGFTVTTGHNPEAIDWETLARQETLVILMGTRTLPTIVSQLQRYGVPGDRPIAILQWAGHPHQRHWVSTLAQVLADTKGERLSPSVIVIGEVVRFQALLRSPSPVPQLDLAPQLAQPQSGSNASPMSATSALPSPTPTQPLTGLTIVVTRAAGQSSAFRNLLYDRGATVLECPTLEITPPSSWLALDQAIAHLDEFDWLILTSANGVTYLWERLLHSGGDGRSLAGLKIAVVGKKTARSLTDHGLQPDFIPPDFVADSLVETFPVESLLNTRILFPRVETGGREVLVREFRDRGALVTEVPAYESRCPDRLDPNIVHALQAEQINMLTFASSKTVRYFWTLAQAELGRSVALARLQSVAIASIGPQTSETCHELLGRVDIEAQEYTLEGLTAAIVTWAQSR